MTLEKRADAELADLSSTWDSLGETDAMWAIYSADPTKLGGKWDPEEFFATGRSEIDAVVATLQSLGARPPFASVLDFGCGVGRLSRALATHSARVTGVDIAPSMIERAKQLNPDESRFRWVLNQDPDLRVFGDGEFDLIYTNIVLQHMPTRFAKAYVAEFFRIAKPGGWVVFQVPDTDTLTLKRKMANFVYNRVVPHVPGPITLAMRRRRYPNASIEQLRGLRFMQMYGMGRREVTAAVESAAGEVRRADVNDDAGAGWDSVRYYALKTTH